MPKRRDYGTGGISKRKDGRWQGSYYDGNGKRRFVVAATQREAKEKLTAAQRDLEQGIALEPGKEKVGAFLLRWLEAARPSLRSRTADSYAGIIKQYLDPQLGQQTLKKLTAPQVQTAYTLLLERGLSAKTVRNAHICLHRALADALRWNLVARNVADAVTAPRPTRYYGVTLTPAQAEQLLAAAQGHRVYAVLRMAISTGMRQGELLALHWTDVDWEHKTVAVRRTLHRRGPGWKLEEPKTAHSSRTIPLGDALLATLRRWQQDQRLERVALGDGWKGNGFMFTSTVGSPMHGGILTRQLQEFLERAGLPRIRFHDLRHTTASLLLASGVHPKVVQELLGHANISVTLDTYSHVLPGLERKALDGLDGMLGTGS